MSPSTVCVPSLLVAIVLARPQGPEAAPPAAAAPAAIVARPEVTRAEIEAHVRRLASDELGGRKTGTEGAILAARHLADALARCGVQPAGDEGTFLQAVPLVRIRATAVPELSLRARDGAAIVPVHGADFEVSRVAIDGKDLRVLVAASASAIPEKDAPDAAIFLDTGRGTSRRWLEESGHAEGKGFAAVIVAGSGVAGEAKPQAPTGESIDLVGSDERVERPRITIRGPLLERFRRGEIESLSLRTHVLFFPLWLGS